MVHFSRPWYLKWFLEKMKEIRPPLKLKNNGGLLSAKNQVFTFYTIVRTRFPNDCERCYEVLGVTNAMVIPK